MRLVFFLFSFILVVRFSSAQNNGVITISIDDEVSLHGFSFWPEIKLTSKDTTINYILHARSPEQVANLKATFYTATLTSIFGHKIIQTIDLSKKSTATLSFKGLKKYYKKSPTNESFCDNMKESDTLFIIHNSTGGVSPVIDKISITKNGEGYKAHRYLNLAADQQSTKKLSKEIFNQFHDAEAHIRKVTNKIPCESMETYTFEMSKKTFTINIIDCTGIDLSKIIKAAFPED